MYINSKNPKRGIAVTLASGTTVVRLQNQVLVDWYKTFFLKSSTATRRPCALTGAPSDYWAIHRSHKARLRSRSNQDRQL